MASPGTTGRHGPPLSGPDSHAAEKEAASLAAAELVQDGMRVGLGTGSTVAHVLPAIAARKLRGLRCVATSPETQREATALGLPLADLDDLGELDIAIDGADQIDPAGWLIKGAGGAHTRERIVAIAAREFVVVASSDKPVERLGPPIPLEVLSFAVGTTLERLAPARLRERGARETPNGGLLADYYGPVGDPAELMARLRDTAGLIDHGLFAPELVSLVLIGTPEGVQRRAGAKPAT